MVRSAIAESATSATRSFGPLGRVALDIGVPGLAAGVGRAVLAGPRADQQGPHRVRVAGQVGQHMGPRPAGQQGWLPQIRLGDHPGRAEQALRRVVDLVVELALRGVHLFTLEEPPPPPGGAWRRR